MNILIADDDVVTCTILVRVIKKLGHYATCLYTGCKVIEYLTKGNIDVLILDIIMPDKEGLEILHELIGLKSEVKIIVISSKESYLEIAEVYGDFLDVSILKKPIDYDSLEELINSKN